jgi:hypothetical protein
MSDLRRRIETLEATLPKPVVLILDDGSTFRHPGPALKFYCEIVAQIYAGQGPLLDIVRRAVRSEGFGRKMLELCKAILEPGKQNVG